MEIKRVYVDGDYQVTEFTNGYSIKIPIEADVVPGETLPVPPTFDQRLQALEEAMSADLGL